MFAAMQMTSDDAPSALAGFTMPGDQGGVSAPPSAPSAFTVTADNGNMNGAWTPGAGATFTEVSRQPAAGVGGTWAVIAASVASASYLDTGASSGLNAAGKFDYRIRAGNSGGYSSYVTVTNKTPFTVYDSFTDTNGTAISSHTPDIGSAPTGGSGVTIQGNKAQGSGNLYTTPAIYNSGLADFYLRCVCQGTWDVDGSSHQALPDLAVRLQDATNYYTPELGSDLVRLYKDVANSFTLMDSAALTLTTAVAHTVEVWCSAAHITVAVDGTVLLSDYNQTTFQTAAKQGLTGVTTATPPAVLATWSNFSVSAIRTLKHMFYGDSRVYGFGLSSPTTQNPAYIAGNLMGRNTVYANYGHPGYTIQQLNDQVDTLFTPYLDNTVGMTVIQLWAEFNDYAVDGVTPATAYSRMKTLVSTIRNRCAANSVTNYKIYVTLSGLGMVYQVSGVDWESNWRPTYTTLLLGDNAGADGIVDLRTQTVTYQNDASDGVNNPSHVHPDQAGALTIGTYSAAQLKNI